MERKTMPRIVALLLAVLLTCTSIFSAPVEAQAATSATKITLSATKRTLCVGKSFKLSVKSVSPSGASKAVTYKSSNKKVATVSSKGKVTAKKTGKATITVTSKSNKKVKAKCTVTVTKGVEEIQTAATIVMQKGKWVNLRYDITPNKGVNKKVTFKSSKPSVVKVSKKGKLTAKKVGKAKVTIQSADGGAKKVVNVTVKKKIKPVTKVTLDKTKLSLLNGSSDTLHATVAPSNATRKKVYFVSSDTSIARVNNAGRVVAKGDGTAKIYAYASDSMANRAVCTVTVTSPSPNVVPGGGVKVTGVTLDRTSLVMTAGGNTEQLKAIVAPADATNPAVVWESSDTTTATVENGLVTPLRAGTTTISATTVDGGFKASCEVVVNAQYIPVEGVILAPSMALEVGDITDPVVMAVIPTNATNQAVTWSTSDSKIATVSEYGEVTAVAKGTATVTVTTADGEKKANCEVTVRTPETIRVENIHVTPKTGELVVGGEPLQLNAAVTPDNATDKTVVWASSNPAVASVSQYGGLVTPLSAGRAMIYAQSNNGQRDYCEIEVRQPLSSVSLDKEELVLDQGKESNLKVSLNPANAAVEKVEWSSDSDVIQVISENTILSDGTGNATVRANGVGTAKVTVKVTTKDGEYSATCDVTSNKVDIEVTDITLAPAKVTVPVGSTQELMPVFLPSNATVKPELTWTSSNSNVASVNAKTGVITAVAEGTAVITAATSNGLSATAEVQVVTNDNYVAVENIALTPSSLSAPIRVGETVSFTATVTPQNATDAAVTWRSADESVITVSNTGVVTAVGEGTAKVIATAGGKITSCDVTVYKALESITVTGDQALVAGEHGQVMAALNPKDATCRSIKWESSNTDIATVIADGTVEDGNIKAVVHAIDAGTADISITVVMGDGTEMKQSMAVTVTKPFVPLNKISFIRDELVMQGGNVTNQITVLFDPENTTERDVVWTSSNETIATVDENGVVTSKSGVTGTATVTATVTKQDGTSVQATMLVRVTPGDGRVSKITLDKQELAFILDEEPTTYTLIPTIEPEEVSNNTVFWLSLDEKVATVDNKGVVTAVGEGMTTIIAVTQDGGKSAFCNVTVSKQAVPVTKVTVESEDGSTRLKKGDIKAFKAVIEPAEATYKEVTWSSSNEAVAVVDPKTGVVTAVGAGTVTITATADHDNVSGSVDIEVYVPIEKVTLDQEEINVKLNHKEAIVLTASVEPEEAANAAGAKLVWEVDPASENADAITIVPSEDTMSATVILNKGGKAIIKAKAADDVKASDDAYATCNVTVVEREKAFRIIEDEYGDISQYVLEFDRTADEYEVKRGNGNTFVTTSEDVEHDFDWVLSQFTSGQYDNDFLKNFWMKFDWNNVVNNSYVLKSLLDSNFLATGERINVEVTSSTTIEVTVSKGGNKTKKATITRIDHANGSDLLIETSTKQVRVTDIEISKENEVVEINATVNVAGGMKLRAEISENGFTLYKEQNGRDRVVMQAAVNEDKFVCRINAIYYEEMMGQLGYEYDPSKMDAYNIYKKAEQK